MKKFKDRVILGTAAALTVSSFIKALNAFQYKRGMIDLRFNQPAASLFIPKEEAMANTIEGKILASAVNNTMVCATGTAITYLLTFTGRDYAMLKGAGFTLLEWIGFWGIMPRLGLTIKAKRTITDIYSMIEHIVLGAGIGLFVSKLGDDSLFPDAPSNDNEVSQTTQTTEMVSPSTISEPLISTASMASPPNEALAGGRRIKPIKTIKLTRKHFRH